TGRGPFGGAPATGWGQLVMGEPAPPAEHRPGLDPGLEALVLKAMAQRKENRFGSVAEFAEALDRHLGGNEAVDPLPTSEAELPLPGRATHSGLPQAQVPTPAPRSADMPTPKAPVSKPKPARPVEGFGSRPPGRPPGKSGRTELSRWKDVVVAP